MTLVSEGRPGRHRHLSQAELESYPLTSCTGWALAICLEWAGLHIEDPRWFITRGRRQTGVAEVKNGRTQGTSIEDWQRAFGDLLPWIVIGSGWMDQSAFLDGLHDGDFAAAVGVTYSALPTRQRRYSPRFRGDHRIALTGARIYRGTWQVFMDDPLGTGNYSGEWVDWTDVRKAIAAKGSVSGSLVWVATIGKEAGLQTSIILDRALTPGATAAVPKGSDTFRVDPTTLRLTPGKPTSSKATVPVDASVMVKNLPPMSPSGKMVRGTNGTYYRLSDAVVTEPVASDCASQVEAVRVSLTAEIAERDLAIATAEEAFAKVTP